MMPSQLPRRRGSRDRQASNVGDGSICLFCPKEESEIRMQEFALVWVGNAFLPVVAATAIVLGNHGYISGQRGTHVCTSCYEGGNPIFATGRYLASHERGRFHKKDSASVSSGWVYVWNTVCNWMVYSTAKLHVTDNRRDHSREKERRVATAQSDMFSLRSPDVFPCHA